MNNNEHLIREAKNFIRLKAFQNIVPSINSLKKQPYIDYLLRENPDKLKNLVNFWKINHSRNLFLFRLSIEEPLTSSKIVEKLNGHRTTSDDDEPVYEVITTNLDSELNDLYIFLKVHS